MTVTKLPQITLAFWIMKIAATTLGETAGDLLAQTLKVGYLTSSLILVSLFLVSLVTQLKARKFHPALYWAVILSTSTAGTTMSDFMNRSAGLGYTNGALVLLSLLAGVFVLWKYTGNSFDTFSHDASSRNSDTYFKTNSNSHKNAKSDANKSDGKEAAKPVAPRRSARVVRFTYSDSLRPF